MGMLNQPCQAMDDGITQEVMSVMNDVTHSMVSVHVSYQLFTDMN